MAIHGKQLKDASIDLTKLEGIAAAPTAGQLLVAAANGGMQALTVGGNLSASVNGGTLDLSIGAGTIQLSMIDGDAIVSESEGITNNDNDTTIPTSAAVKDYVDSSVGASGSMSGFNIKDSSSTTQPIGNADTITFAGTANEIEVAVSATDTVTIGLPNDVTIGNHLTVTGDLTVSGSTTTVNTTTLDVEDKNIELGKVGTPTDTTADGGGLTLKGSTDKTFNWVNTTGSWTSSEHMDLAATKEYKIGTTSVLTANGAAKVQSGVAGDGLAHSASTGVLSLDLNELTGATVDVAADSIAIIDADNSNGSRKQSIAGLATAMAGSGITATNGVLSAASGSLKIVDIVPSNSLSSGKIVENGQSGAYTLPSSPSGQVQLSINGVIQKLGGNSGQGDYYINSSNEIEWNNSNLSLDNTDTIIFTYVPA